MSNELKNGLWNGKRLLDGASRILTALQFTNKSEDESLDKIMLPIMRASNIKNALKIMKTGVSSLDVLINGVYPGEILNLHGPSRQGKTQICLHALSKMSTFYSCVFIGFVFPIERIIQTLSVLGIPEREIKEKLENITFCQALTNYDTIVCINNLISRIRTSPVHLLIIDSIFINAKSGSTLWRVIKDFCLTFDVACIFTSTQSVNVDTSVLVKENYLTLVRSTKCSVKNNLPIRFDIIDEGIV